MLLRKAATYAGRANEARVNSLRPSVVLWRIFARLGQSVEDDREDQGGASLDLRLNGRGRMDGRQVDRRV